MRGTTVTLGATSDIVTVSSAGAAITGTLSATAGANFATSSGSVGIGTSSPAEKLNVVGGNIKTDSTSRKIGYWEADTVHDGYFIPYNASGQLEIVNTFSTGAVLFKTGTSATERMRIDSSGNVGIGTTSPATKLDVDGLVTTQGLRSASNMTIQTNNANDDITLATTGSSGYIILNGSTTSIGIANTTTKITSTLTYGPVYDATENNTDNVGRGIFNFIRGTTTVGQIVTTNSTCAYNSVSDYRLKEITGPLVDSGTFIDALKPKVGTWKSNGSKFVGFIAHEFAEISPLSVSGEKDAVDADGKPVYQSMQASTPEVMANIVAELQSLRKRLAAIEAK